MNRKKRWAYLGFIIIVLVSFLFINSSSENTESILYKALHHRDGVSTIKLPDTIYFAGERVPLENFDTREMLERELIVNTYWHSQTLLLLKRSNRFFPVIDSILHKHNIPEDFKYMAVAESGLMQVVSPSQAVGFWQFLEGTARDYGLEVNDIVDERYHVEKSTEAACKYLSESYEKYGNWTLAAASYNAGRRSLSNQIEIQRQNNYYDLLLGEEADRYVFRLIALKMVLEKPSDYGFVSGNYGYDHIPYYSVSVDTNIQDIASFAILHNTNYKMLKMLNPWLRKPYLSIKGKKTYEIKIPMNRVRKASIEFNIRENNQKSGDLL